MTPGEVDFDRIRTRFLQMCVGAESMVRRSLRSLVERDPALGRTVIAADSAIDAHEIEVDRLCLAYLADHRPAGTRLRTITTLMKMVTDLERIGDLSVNVAQRGLELSAGSGIEPGIDIARMGEIAATMVRHASDAFLEADAEAARRVIARDTEVDDLNRAVLERLLCAMAAHPDQVERLLSLTSTSKYLERIADHACNLGEMVVFLVEGRDVRHQDPS